MEVLAPGPHGGTAIFSRLAPYQCSSLYSEQIFNRTVSDFTSLSRSPKLNNVLSQLSHVEQVRLMMTHPFFTGQCPQCQLKLQLVARVPGQCGCPTCGWTDDLERLSA